MNLNALPLPLALQTFGLLAVQRLQLPVVVFPAHRIGR